MAGEKALIMVVKEVIFTCIKPVWKNIAYPFNVSDNVKALDDATKTLVAIETDVRREVEIASREGLGKTNLVEDWLSQVNGVKTKADAINTRYAGRSQWFRRLNCWSNFWISKDAAKKLKVAQELQKLPFKKVASHLPPQVEEVPIGSEVMQKEEDDLQKVLRYLNNDHNSIIGIWGMGGVGKTRLLQLVHNQYVRSSAFDTVMFVTASKECSVDRIQAELCNKFKFRRENDVDSQARIISQYLSNRSFLLMLDDIWDEIDLQSVGIPYPLGTVNNCKRKVVITTRSSMACNLMGVEESHMVMVAPLAFNDAYSLFVINVGEETIGSHPQIPFLAHKVVKRLDGLPLALITTGKAMRGKKDPKLWDYPINQLHNSHLDEIELASCEEKTYHRLKFSYDSLETTVLKDCFLVCSLWPEDYHIEKDKLIEFWAGFGLLQGCEYDIYSFGHHLIGKLVSACLMEQVGSDNVKMHDVIRDMALWIASDCGENKNKWIVRGVGRGLHQRELWKNVERATLINQRMITNGSDIPYHATHLHFLKVHSIRFCAEPLIKNFINFSNIFRSVQLRHKDFSNRLN